MELNHHGVFFFLISNLIWIIAWHPETFLPKFVFDHIDPKILNQSPKAATFPYQKLDTKLGTGAQDKQAFCVDLEVQQSSSAKPSKDPQL